MRATRQALGNQPTAAPGRTGAPGRPEAERRRPPRRTARTSGVAPTVRGRRSGRHRGDLSSAKWRPRRSRVSAVTVTSQSTNATYGVDTLASPALHGPAGTQVLVETEHLGVRGARVGGTGEASSTTRQRTGRSASSARSSSSERPCTGRTTVSSAGPAVDVVEHGVGEVGVEQPAGERPVRDVVGQRAGPQPRDPHRRAADEDVAAPDAGLQTRPHGVHGRKPRRRARRCR